MKTTVCLKKYVMEKYLPTNNLADNLDNYDYQ